jgi:hypothetical protein
VTSGLHKEPRDNRTFNTAEIEAAATYFSALQPRKRIKVVESDTAPKTYVAGLLCRR